MTDLAVIRQRAEAEQMMDLLNDLRAAALMVKSGGGANWMGIAFDCAHQCTRAADRLEAAQRALVMARTALHDVDIIYPVRCPWCRYQANQSRTGHAPDCKRETALTEIDEALR